MKILAIETSGSLCSVAIENGNMKEEISIDGNNIHDEYLANFVKRCLKDVNLQSDELDVIAVSSGPGSFTGLRIGAAFAKGFCFNGQTKLTPVPTLTAYAFMAKELAKEMAYERIFVYLPSQKDYIFYQIFDINLNCITEIIVEEKVKIDELSKDAYKVSNINFNLSAKIILDLGKELFKNGIIVDSSSFEPSYIQEFKPNTSPKKQLII